MTNIDIESLNISDDTPNLLIQMYINFEYCFDTIYLYYII